MLIRSLSSSDLMSFEVTLGPSPSDCMRPLLFTKVQWFRGGLVSKAHGLLYHSTLGSSVIKQTEKIIAIMGKAHRCLDLAPGLGVSPCVGRSRFEPPSMTVYHSQSLLITLYHSLYVRASPSREAGEAHIFPRPLPFGSNYDSC